LSHSRVQDNGNIADKKQPRAAVQANTGKLRSAACNAAALCHGSSHQGRLGIQPALTTTCFANKALQAGGHTPQRSSCKALALYDSMCRFVVSWWATCSARIVTLFDLDSTHYYDNYVHGTPPGFVRILCARSVRRVTGAHNVSLLLIICFRSAQLRQTTARSYSTDGSLLGCTAAQAVQLAVLAA
jgi:hypothetical protein